MFSLIVHTGVRVLGFVNVTLVSSNVVCTSLSVFVKSDMCHTSLSPVHCSKLMCKCWTLAHVIVSLTVRVGFC